MNQGRIIVITGSPGTGKTTTASIVAKESNMDKSVHMHTDDFFHYLSKGAIPPHLPESNEQNLVVIEAFLEAAKRYARGGYDVIVDGIVGPWFLEPWLNIVEPRQPGGCKLKTAPVRPVVAARPAEYVCSEDLFY